MINFPFYGFPTHSSYSKKFNVNNQFVYKQNSITNTLCDSDTIFNTSEQAIFEIFGIRIFLDDLIIIGILLFLYQEHVKDEFLYLILVLLLIS